MRNSICRTTIFDADADQITQHYRATLSPVVIEPLNGKGRVSVEDSHYSMNAFALWEGKCDSGMEVSFTEPTDLYVIYLPKMGAIDVSIGATKLQLNGNTGLICDFASLEHFRFHQGRGHTGIAISKAFMSRQLSDLLEAPLTKKLEFFPVIDKISPAFNRLSAITSLLWNSLYETQDNIASTQYIEMLFQTIAATALDVIRHNYSDALNTKIPSILPHHVKRAIEFMAENIGESLTVGDIAKVSGASIRSLQDGFQQFKGVSPLQHLRKIRLEQARDALRSNVDCSSVLQIARQSGFTHMGRFSALYHEAFGEYPFETQRTNRAKKRRS